MGFGWIEGICPEKKDLSGRMLVKAIGFGLNKVYQKAVIIGCRQ
jgi:hypothetical protein